MLQQTRVDQAKPYYLRFIDAFPSVHDLAQADLDEVLLIWEGLGYYARARNMHQAARMIVNESGGRFPDTYESIRKLPGVGPYTAAAVLSIAYGLPYAVLDGNVARVLARVFTIEDDIKSGKTRKLLQNLADELLDRQRPGLFNEAMMDLGATICTPGEPACHQCPIQTYCAAFQQNRVNQFPVTSPRKAVPHNDIAVALIFNDEGKILIQRRPEEGLLGGLWEFPGGKRERGETLEETCLREIREELGITIEILEPFHHLSHAYTHFKITMYAYTCRIKSGIPRSTSRVPVEWVNVESLNNYAFPRANRRLIEKLIDRNRSPQLFDL